MLEMTLPVGHAPALHIHDNLDDTWYILDGEMAVRCGDDQMVVGAGSLGVDAAGCPALVQSLGDRPARILTVHDNETFRDFVRELGTPAPDHVVPPHPSFPPMDELIAVFARHDLRPVGPPMTIDQAATILATAPSRSRRGRRRSTCRRHPRQLRPHRRSALVSRAVTTTSDHRATERTDDEHPEVTKVGETMAGPSDRAGFSDADVNWPAISPQAKSTAPTASGLESRSASACALC